MSKNRYLAENDAAPEAYSRDAANSYSSENDALTSSSLPNRWRKKDQMQLRKFMGRDGFTAIFHQSASRELPGDSLENICGGKNEKN